MMAFIDELLLLLGAISTFVRLFGRLQVLQQASNQVLAFEVLPSDQLQPAAIRLPYLISK